MQLRAPITFVTDIAQRMKHARERAGLSQEALAERAGVGQSTIGNIEAGLRQAPRKLLSIAAALGVSAHWLETGRGPQDAGPADAGPVSELARQMSQAQPSMPPVTISWEAILHTTLPPRFALVVVDEAMPPMRPGHRAVFATDREPAGGDVVLLADRDGNPFIREYQLRRPGHWLAAPRGPGFAALDSLADGLRVLAVQVGHEWG